MEQRIYGGDSGLRRGVACSFSTPMGAVHQAGLTNELVARWVKNSNKFDFVVVRCSACVFENTN
jgi:hypothetical protein